ncbi:MAG TPA: acetyl-CoA C-acyltransferase [Conexibacter sp.]|nr:acetyl-CoA C-acyltransferase [Conexibacter sp.]
MPEAVIVDAVRTPIGRAGKGSLRDVRADELAAVPLRALAERNPAVDLAQTADVLMGAAYGEGEQGYNVGRNAALLAGIDERVPACTINRFCASSLQALRSVFHAIRAGEGEQYVAAGVEAVSRIAGGSHTPPHPLLDGSPGAITNVYIPMGHTAENVATRCGVSREQQDAWALTSQARASHARDSGHFDAEIVPVDVPERVGEDGEAIPATRVLRDDGPRPGTTLEGLAALRPAFRPDGTVTAGNACPLNDGAAAVLVTSDARAARLELAPRARIVGSTVVALDPAYMGLGPIPAIRALLSHAGMTVADVDVFEINEAFAAQVVPCMDALGIPAERLNPFGGAIALGHPFGATGARIMTTLLHDLDALDGTFGVEAMCVGGGMGQAMLVERLR